MHDKARVSHPRTATQDLRQAGATVVSNPTRSAYLFWQDGIPGIEALDKSVGPAISLKVNAGDTIKLETYYRYEDKTSYSHANFSLSVLSAALAGSFYQVNVFEGVDFTQTTQAFNTALTAGGFFGSDPDNTIPYAYLNYIVLDAQRTRIASGFERVKDEGAFAPNEETLTGQHARLTLDAPIIIPANGKYIYAWVSNESENTKIWFDDFRVTHTTTFVAETTDYGVWGDVIRTSSVNGERKSIKDNLFAQYLLNGNASDTGPRGLNGTTVSGAITTQDRNDVNGQAYFFDGVNDFVDVPNTRDDYAFVHNTGVFTISLFIKLTDLEGRSAFIGNAVSSVQKGFDFLYENVTGYDHRLRFTIMHGVSGKFTEVVGKPRAINDFNWHHVAVVGDGQTIRLFLDGVEDGYSSSIVGLASGDASAALLIGATRHSNNVAPQLFMHGSLDEINIFNKALSSAEIRLLAQDASLAEVDDILQPEERYRYQYQGQFAERDEETGWNHFELREYDPVVGRWLTIDPYGQFWSPYLGMGNHPTNAIDSDGGRSSSGDPEPWVLNDAGTHIWGYNGITKSYEWVALPTGGAESVADAPWYIVASRWLSNVDFVAETDTKITLGLQGKIGFGEFVKLDANIVSGTLFRYKDDITENGIELIDYVGDGSGLELKEGFALELGAKAKNKNFVIAAGWEQAQRVHKKGGFFSDSPLKGEKADAKGFYYQLFNKSGSSSGYTGKTGVSAKAGKLKECNCIELKAEAALLLGVEGALRIGFK